MKAETNDMSSGAQQSHLGEQGKPPDYTVIKKVGATRQSKKPRGDVQGKLRRSKKNQAYTVGAHSSFRNTLLTFARNQLNLMLSEVCQLKGADVDFSCKEKLTRTVLQKIANKEITSPHISAEQANNYLNLLATCDQKKQNYLLSHRQTDTPASPDSIDEEERSPFFSSPY